MISKMEPAITEVLVPFAVAIVGLAAYFWIGYRFWIHSTQMSPLEIDRGLSRAPWLLVFWPIFAVIFLVLWLADWRAGR